MSTASTGDSAWVELLVSQTAGKLHFAGQKSRFIESDDELDALISALMARAAALGRVESIPRKVAARVLTEGWIQLPVEDGTVSDVFV